MPGVVNEVLGFFSEQWELFAYVGAAAVLLFVQYVIVTRIGQDTEEQITFQSAPPVNYDAEKHRLQGFVNELRSHIGELKQRIIRLTNQNAVLAPLIKELNSHLDKQRMGPIVMRTLERIFAPKRALVFFMETDRETLTLADNVGVQGLPQAYQLKIGKGFAGLVAAKRRTVTKENLYSDPNFAMMNVDDLGPDAEGMDIATPILNRGEPLGVLCMGEMREFSEDDRALFGIIANMTALALVNYLQYKKIEQLANHDPLTGVYNKGHFIREATSSLVDANRDGVKMSLVMFDVDHFKHYNDTNGHLAGDRLLAALAELPARWRTTSGRPWRSILSRAGPASLSASSPSVAGSRRCRSTAPGSRRSPSGRTRRCTRPRTPAATGCSRPPTR